jgi:hypothetical protein
MFIDFDLGPAQGCKKQKTGFIQKVANKTKNRFFIRAPGRLKKTKNVTQNPDIKKA